MRTIIRTFLQAFVVFALITFAVVVVSQLAAYLLDFTMGDSTKGLILMVALTLGGSAAVGAVTK